MNPTGIQTKSLNLIPQTRDQARARIAAIPAQERAHVSAAWLALLDGSEPIDPWVHGFVIEHRATDRIVGSCGFKGPPAPDGAVEIAYGVNPEHQGNGYATEAAAALVSYAFNHPEVRLVRAHTLPQPSASTRVLTKCGFHRAQDVVDPEDGPVWRWERRSELV